MTIHGERDWWLQWAGDSDTIQHTDGCEGSAWWGNYANPFIPDEDRAKYWWLYCCECLACGRRDCPQSDPMHYHHDGCPSCWTAEAVTT